MLLQHFIRIRICIPYLHSHSAFANSSARKFNILLAKDSLLFICLAISAQLDFEFDVDFPFFLEFFGYFEILFGALTTQCLPLYFNAINCVAVVL